MADIIRYKLNAVKNEPFTVELQRSSGTGYAWALGTLPSNTLLIAMDTSTPTDLDGGPVIDRFYFVASASPDKDIQFLLIRPWEAPGSTQCSRADITVTVGDAANEVSAVNHRLLYAYPPQA